MVAGGAAPGAGGTLSLVPIVDDGSAPPKPAEVCTVETFQAESVKKPLDILVVVDNSGSMGEETAAIEANVNKNFAQILAASGIDYRVILFGWDKVAFGGGLGVCVEPPLGPSPCKGRGATDSPNASPRFFHFLDEVGSTDAWCRLSSTAAKGPFTNHWFAMSPIGPNGRPKPKYDPLFDAGWVSLLRPDAFKSLLVITDDTMGLTVRPDGAFSCDRREGRPTLPQAAEFARTFDDWLLRSYPTQFGTKDQRNYVYHSIVGVAEKANPTEAYLATEPIVAGKCDTAENSGPPHQYLSQLTGGLRFPVCHTQSYDAVFQQIAQSVSKVVKLACSWKVPEPPQGKTFDPGLLNLQYLPDAGGVAVDLVNVESQAACGAQDAWYYDNPQAPAQVLACPATCSKLEQNVTGKLDLKLGCATRRYVP